MNQSAYLQKFEELADSCACKGTRGKVVGSEGFAPALASSCRAVRLSLNSVRLHPTLFNENLIKKACSVPENQLPSTFELIQTRRPHAASAHASFAGGEPKEMTCGFFVLHRCILLAASSQSRWRAQRARPHERAHAPPARADTHTRQTPASMQRAVRRRGPRLNLRRHCVHATNYLLCYGHRPDKPWEATVQP